jgi:hypothetical protein
MDPAKSSPMKSSGHYARCVVAGESGEPRNFLAKFVDRSKMSCNGFHDSFETKDAFGNHLGFASIEEGDDGNTALLGEVDIQPPSASGWRRGANLPYLEVQMAGPRMNIYDMQTGDIENCPQSNFGLPGKIQPKNIPLAGQVDATPDRRRADNDEKDRKHGTPTFLFVAVTVDFIIPRALNCKREEKK